MSTQYWPFVPACSNKKFYGRKLPFALAAKHAYIQTNQENLIRWIVFDIDREGAAVSWDDRGLPPPTWIATNPANGHAHLCYGLSTPVRTEGKGVRHGPVRYLRQIQLAMAKMLEADLAYNGILTKNPYSDHWKTIWHGQMYSLGDLEEYIKGDLSDYSKPKISIGANTDEEMVGRNVAVFNATRRWAYKRLPNGVREKSRQMTTWESQIFEAASSVNSELERPLDEKEVWHISKSISKWTARHLSSYCVNFSQKQRERANRLSLIRQEKQRGRAMAARNMANQGLRPSEIAKAMEASLSSVYRWLKQTQQPLSSDIFVVSHEPISDNSGGATEVLTPPPVAPAFFVPALSEILFVSKRLSRKPSFEAIFCPKHSRGYRYFSDDNFANPPLRGKYSLAEKWIGAP